MRILNAFKPFLKCGAVLKRQSKLKNSVKFDENPDKNYRTKVNGGENITKHVQYVDLKDDHRRISVEVSPMKTENLGHTAKILKIGVQPMRSKDFKAYCDRQTALDFSFIDQKNLGDTFKIGKISNDYKYDGKKIEFDLSSLLDNESVVLHTDAFYGNTVVFGLQDEKFFARYLSSQIKDEKKGSKEATKKFDPIFVVAGKCTGSSHSGQKTVFCDYDYEEAHQLGNAFAVLTKKAGQISIKMIGTQVEIKGNSPVGTQIDTLTATIAQV